MSIKEHLENLEESLGRVHRRGERQEDVITQFRVDQSGINGEFQTDITNIKESVKNLAGAVGSLQEEFSNKILKIVLWCVSMVLGLLGLVAAVWKAATSF